MQFNISPGTSRGGTAPEVRAAGEHREPLGLRQHSTQRSERLQTGRSSEARPLQAATEIPSGLAAYSTSKEASNR